MDNIVESVSNICRICLQQIEDNVQFYFLNNEAMLQSKLLDFLPEIALNATQNPIICNQCTITIDGIHEFKQLCLRTESIIIDLTMQQKPFEDVLNYVKKDTVHETIKEELVEDTIIKDEPQVVYDDCLQVNTDLPVCIDAPTKPLFYCYTCNYYTDTKTNLAQHIHSHCPQLQKIRRIKFEECSYMTPLANNHRNPRKLAENYKCDECDYSSKFKQVFKRHMYLKHYREKLLKNYDKCDEWENSFVLKHNLKSFMIHMYNREKSMKRHKCSECNYSSMNRYNVKGHEIRMHNREKLVKNYKCDECDYSSVIKQNVKSHAIRIHNKEKFVKNLKCGECEYATNSRMALVIHNRSHTGEKPYKCNICDYRSSCEGNLKTHLAKHSREKPFKCKLCNYSSTKNQILKIHQQQHLEKPILHCDKCSFKTLSCRHLKQHRCS